jgi:hypothetical protein
MACNAPPAWMPPQREFMIAVANPLGVLEPDGVQALFDNCHSGTALDLQYCRRCDDSDRRILAENGRVCEEPDSFGSPTETVMITNMDTKFQVDRKTGRGSTGALRKGTIPIFLRAAKEYFQSFHISARLVPCQAALRSCNPTQAKE